MPRRPGVVILASPAFGRERFAIVAGLALIVLWETLGWDLRVSQLFGSIRGFALRDAWFTDRLLHTGGRWLAGFALAVLVVDLVRPLAQGPTRAQRAYWLAVTVAVLLLVPAIKRVSLTSCPWDLAEFGAAAAYVPHWLAGVSDGGPGHCFPSGHAVSAFGFFGLYFLWRPYSRRSARVILATVIALGLAYGMGQLARGAHFVSHTMWSAWIAWTLCVLAGPFDPGRATRWFGRTAQFPPLH